MAERRMFAKTIIDSDAFLDMPVTAQLLYFHLSMRADDDGFINKPKTIMRMCGCKDDDIKLLFAKKFVIPFETGIVVIKHWKIHNYIRKDTYTETKYKDEKALLELDENNAYRQLPEPALQFRDESVTGTSTQDRLGKDRLGKDSLGEYIEDSEGEPPTPPPAKVRESLDYEYVQNMYNSYCPSLPKCKSLSDARKKAIRARIKSGRTMNDFGTLFEKAEASSFLKGQNDRNWTANFDWLIKDSNMAKVLDGNYDNKPKYGRKEVVPQWCQTSSAPTKDALEHLKKLHRAVTAEDDPELAERAERLKRNLRG